MEQWSSLCNGTSLHIQRAITSPGTERKMDFACIIFSSRYSEFQHFRTEAGFLIFWKIFTTLSASEQNVKLQANDLKRSTVHSLRVTESDWWCLCFYCQPPVEFLSLFLSLSLSLQPPNIELHHNINIHLHLLIFQFNLLIIFPFLCKTLCYRKNGKLKHRKLKGFTKRRLSQLLTDGELDVKKQERTRYNRLVRV